MKASIREASILSTSYFANKQGGEMIGLRREFMDVVGLMTVDELIGNNGLVNAIQEVYDELSGEHDGGKDENRES